MHGRLSPYLSRGADYNGTSARRIQGEVAEEHRTRPTTTVAGHASVSQRPVNPGRRRLGLGGGGVACRVLACDPVRAQ